MQNFVPRELQQLDHIARALAETGNLKDVKAIRDKAEAARHLAKSAALGLRIQNQAAELKLRAERRAGKLLSELVTRGGDQKSNRHDDRVKLDDLGIDYNQSSRWQREAAVPEHIFERYLAEANARGRDITSQGLLRLERIISKRLPTTRSSKRIFSGRANTMGPDTFVSSDEPTKDLLDELLAHRGLLEQILAPLCRGESSNLRRPEKLLILRLLRDIHVLGEALQHIHKHDSRVS